MATKLLVLASFVALTSANLGAPTASVIPVLYVPDNTPKNDSKTEAAGQNHADPIIIAVYDFQKIFYDTLQLKPPYHYSYGYEVYDWKTGLTQSHYEIRHGDLAVGTYIQRASDVSRIVEYTVDTPNGFYGVIRQDFVDKPIYFGYASIGAPLAYASHPPPEEYASRTTILANPEAVENSAPVTKIAYAHHDVFIGYMNLTSPFRYSAGYEYIDSQTGITTSQYETYHGNIGEGSCMQIVDGTRSSVDYSMSPKSFAVTSPQTTTLKANP